MTVDFSLARGGYQPFRNLSKWERCATPKEFAEYLIALVQPKAVLWVGIPTVYSGFRGLELYNATRDAFTFNGPGPIIAHPPCGPWGKYKGQTFWDDQSHGVKAMEFVHRFGGVVEQPLGSTLFRVHGKPSGQVIRVNQGDYGHRSLKPTLLYVHSGGLEND